MNYEKDNASERLGAQLDSALIAIKQLVSQYFYTVLAVVVWPRTLLKKGTLNLADPLLMRSRNFLAVNTLLLFWSFKLLVMASSMAGARLSAQLSEELKTVYDIGFVAPSVISYLTVVGIFKITQGIIPGFVGQKTYAVDLLSMYASAWSFGAIALYGLCLSLGVWSGFLSAQDVVGSGSGLPRSIWPIEVMTFTTIGICVLVASAAVYLGIRALVEKCDEFERSKAVTFVAIRQGGVLLAALCVGCGMVWFRKADPALHEVPVTTRLLSVGSTNSLATAQCSVLLLSQEKTLALDANHFGIELSDEQRNSASSLDLPWNARLSSGSRPLLVLKPGDPLEVNFDVLIPPYQIPVWRDFHKRGGDFRLQMFDLISGKLVTLRGKYSKEK